MTAQAKFIDPKRNHILFDTSYPVVSLSHIAYATFDKNEKMYKLELSDIPMLVPMVVLPIFNKSSDVPTLTIYEMSTALSDFTDKFPNDDRFYMSVRLKIKAYSEVGKFPEKIPVFIFDLPELAMKSDVSAGLRVYNPDTGRLTFDSRVLPLDVVGVCKRGVRVDGNKKYGYVDLAGGVSSREFRQYISIESKYKLFPKHKPYYEISDGMIDYVNSGTLEYSSYTKDDVKNLKDPYLKFYAWLDHHLLVDLTKVYNSFEI